MSYFNTGQEWLDQSGLLIQASPTTVRALGSTLAQSWGAVINPPRKLTGVTADQNHNAILDKGRQAPQALRC